MSRAGVIERSADGNDVRYVLTPAGKELQPVVEALGAWGIRWIGEFGDADLDPKLLLWDMHRNVDLAAIPDGRTVIQFRFPDAPAERRDWWLIITSDETDVCDVDPGFGVTVSLTASLRTHGQDLARRSQLVPSRTCRLARGAGARRATPCGPSLVQAVWFRVSPSAGYDVMETERRGVDAGRRGAAGIPVLVCS